MSLLDEARGAGGGGRGDLECIGAADAAERSGVGRELGGGQGERGGAAVREGDGSELTAGGQRLQRGQIGGGVGGGVADRDLGDMSLLDEARGAGGGGRGDLECIGAADAAERSGVGRELGGGQGKRGGAAVREGDASELTAGGQRLQRGQVG